MGTLTAGQPRLAHYCEHKLPTSCRLSSIGECCACYDNRAHATSYSTYIDGVGFVPRGTRWQRYCWFCKEFWENRVGASGLRPAQTRIPAHPDQAQFLQRWYEFHQGYRIVQHDDGTEERSAVLGEDLREVSPGLLPRTLDELRAGRERSEMEEREREERLRRETSAHEQLSEGGPSLDDTLDQMFQAAAEESQQQEQSRPIDLTQQESAEISSSNRGNMHAQAMTAAGTRNREYQARRIAALRRELHRMRNGIERVISGLRDLGEEVPDSTEASTRLSELGQTLDTISGAPSQQEAQRAIESVNTITERVATTQSDRTLANIQARVNEARQHVEEARRNRDQAATELDSADEEFRASQSRLRQTQNEQRTTENYMRLFGTREEMLAQGEDYESPIGGMFSRAMERFRAAEEVRREQRTLRQVLADEQQGGEHSITRLAELEALERDVWGVPRPLEHDTHVVEDNSLQQTAIASYVSPEDTSFRAPIQGRFGTPQTESDPRGDEVGLEEYYALLRRQNWTQQIVDSSEATNQEVANQPASLARNDSEIVSNSQDRLDRSSAIAEMIVGATEAADAAEAANITAPPAVAGHPIVAGPPGQQLDEDPYANNDRGRDALYVLSALSDSESLRHHVPWISMNIINRLLHRVQSNGLDWADRENIEALVEDTNIIWGCRLPAERNRRRRQRGEQVGFMRLAHDTASNGHVIVHDIEVMAECFQMSSEIRGLSGSPSSQQTEMFNRLQRGDRNSDDRLVLANMLRDNDILTSAKEVLEQHGNEPSAAQTQRRRTMEYQRREMARSGNHSRTELDAQRIATRAFALAAGRAAMDAGPSALLERMANRDEETRAAYLRLQENGFAPAETMTSRRLREPFYRPLSLGDFAASPSASDSEESDADARGLDAKNSGRPEEPLTEEQMTVLLDCRICYSQKADICTVPCGHLAMCRWCSDQHSPTMAHDQTRPRRVAACPVCRKQIRQKIKVVRS